MFLHSSLPAAPITLQFALALWNSAFPKKPWTDRIPESGCSAPSLKPRHSVPLSVCAQTWGLPGFGGKGCKVWTLA